MSLFRIYFDTNAFDELGRFDLGITGSLEVIMPVADKLKDGMHVIIYMAEELEMDATLEFDLKHNRWWARPIEGTLKYLS